MHSKHLKLGVRTDGRVGGASSGGRTVNHPVQKSKSNFVGKKQKGKLKGKRGGGGNSGQIVTVPFADLYNTTVASTSSSSLLMNPSVIPILTSVGSTYQNFRFTEFHCYLHSCNVAQSTNENIWALGYSADVSAGIAGIVSTSQVVQCMPSATQLYSGVNGQTSGFSDPNAHMKLGRKLLLSNTSLKWYKCVGDSDTNAWENFQFQLIFFNATGANNAYYITMTGKCEFSSPIPSVLTLGVYPKSTLRQVQDNGPKSVPAKTADEIVDMIRNCPLVTPPKEYVSVYAPLPPEYPRKKLVEKRREIPFSPQ